MAFYGVGAGAASDYFNTVNKGLDNLVDSNNNPGALDNAVNMVPGRVPWLMSTTEWLEQGMGIIWFANPSDISWKLKLRQSTSKNAHSTVTHNWPNDVRGTNFDEYVLSMTLQTGNLMPYSRANPTEPIDSERHMAPGLVNFYDFLKLLDAPKLTGPGPDGKGGGRTNHVIIKYRSNIFPDMTLIGQFDPEGTSFNDTSQDPMNVSSWSVQFIVTDTFPRLSDNTDSFRNQGLFNAYVAATRSAFVTRQSDVAGQKDGSIQGLVNPNRGLVNPFNV